MSERNDQMSMSGHKTDPRDFPFELRGCPFVLVADGSRAFIGRTLADLARDAFGRLATEPRPWPSSPNTEAGE